ncbi:M15 family metallopeptidase [Agaribacter marinus]|uniref:D-alanyl-D-alanine carboxypeptidase n=1 Tax=Agaribacter marinus TaxID=1431249 RepID=A0AA37WHW3_9ALTE|nr:M15 family metallopeptidase [Agaribacter marinus]GLR70217.1 D-alanyl-D-alanine carboxypeptidase [Agaribacter marinus]
MITKDQILGIDDAHLVTLPNGHQLMPEVAEKFAQMQASAALDGHDLQICSSFRSFDRQLSIWNRKWQGELPLNTLNGTQLNANELSDENKIHAIMLWSALPGASRHHWGTDFDVYDKSKVDLYTAETQGSFELIPEEYEGNGPCAQLSLWLLENAKRFGFYFPYASYRGGVAKEPWHLSYRPIAENIIADFSLRGLSKQLNMANFLGKEAVIPSLSTLFSRYTLNNGTQ